MSIVTILRGGKRVSTASGTGETILAVLQRAGIPIVAPCGGNGICGKCLVTRVTGHMEETVAACREIVTEDCTVLLPELSEDGISSEIQTELTDGSLRPGFGLAVDLGTTTVVAALLRYSDGKCLGIQRAYNVQTAYGSDVLTRVQYIMEHSDGLEMLSGWIRKQIHTMLEALCEAQGIAVEAVQEFFLSGNTIMQHIFAGIDPSSIAVAPFVPETLFLEPISTVFPEFAGKTVRFSPCVAGFVGGDIVSGLLSSDLAEKQGTYLYLDIGTNGEMALFHHGAFLCCSVASGPAFEGAEISCGMTGTRGAISHVSLDGGALRLNVIGDCEIRGICGSGLIDLLAVLLENGVIDETGRLLPPEELEAEIPKILLDRLGEDENENGVFYLTADHRISLTAGDVRKLQLAKAAVAAGIDVLLQTAEISVRQLDGILIAGGFGENLNAEAAMRIGMIPEIRADQITFVGNSSLSGACMALTRPETMREMLELQRKCRYLELSGHALFRDLFVEKMMFE